VGNYQFVAPWHSLHSVTVTQAVAVALMPKVGDLAMNLKFHLHLLSSAYYLNLRHFGGRNHLTWLCLKATVHWHWQQKVIIVIHRRHSHAKRLHRYRLQVVT
jgi:hypothetical protein